MAMLHAFVTEKCLAPHGQELINSFDETWTSHQSPAEHATKYLSVLFCILAAVMQQVLMVIASASQIGLVWVQGAAAVAAAIALAPSLQRLNLEGNSLSIAGACKPPIRLMHDFVSDMLLWHARRVRPPLAGHLEDIHA